MNEIQKLESWKKELALAETYEEIKIHSSAGSAAAEFARRQGVALKKQNDIGRFRLDVEEKMGGWLDEHFKQGGDRIARSDVSTLKDEGISKDESSNARLINREKEITNEVMDAIEEMGEVITPNKVTTEVRKRLKYEANKDVIIQPEFDETITTDYQCPSCGYEW